MSKWIVGINYVELAVDWPESEIDININRYYFRHALAAVKTVVHQYLG